MGPMGRSNCTVRKWCVYPSSGSSPNLDQEHGRVIHPTDKDQSTWLFDVAGRLTQIRDRHGNVSNWFTTRVGNWPRSATRPAAAPDPDLHNGQAHGGDRLGFSSPVRHVSVDATGDLGRSPIVKGSDNLHLRRLEPPAGDRHERRGKVALADTYVAQGHVATQKDARGASTGEATTFDSVVNPDGARVTTSTAPPTSFEPSFQPTMVDASTLMGG